MQIFIGLGNPGEEYASTYHNVGQMALLALTRDIALHKQNAKPEPWVKYKDILEYIETDGTVFVRPLTYMNESGRAVREAVKKFKAKPENLVLFHDDSDITIGDYKISVARNSAGHKGVQSVIDALKTNTFTRVRIGIRPAREPHRQKAGEFALKQITPRDKTILKSVFLNLTEYIRTSFETNSSRQPMRYS
jgi:PTH1 family peptidyl-tRNA hydrolase